MTELQAVMFRTGNTWAIRIPAALIKCKVLDPEKPVRVVFDQEQKGGTGVICHNYPFFEHNRNLFDFTEGFTEKTYEGT